MNTPQGAASPLANAFGVVAIQVMDVFGGLAGALPPVHVQPPTGQPAELVCGRQRDLPTFERVRAAGENKAHAAGLPIVAAERDYVRDVVAPAQTFDPESPLSIARAIRRLLGTPEVPAPPLTPAEFMHRVITDGI